MLQDLEKHHQKPRQPKTFTISSHMLQLGLSLHNFRFFTSSCPLYIFSAFIIHSLHMLTTLNQCVCVHMNFGKMGFCLHQSEKKKKKKRGNYSMRIVPLYGLVMDKLDTILISSIFWNSDLILITNTRKWQDVISNYICLLNSLINDFICQWLYARAEL